MTYKRKGAIILLSLALLVSTIVSACSQSIEGADLIVADIAFSPSVPNLGDTVQVSITFENQGSEPSPECHWSFLPRSGWEIAGALPSLNPGESYTDERPFTCDTVGPSDTIAIVDTDAEVEESDDNNNALSKVLTVGESSTTITPVPTITPTATPIPNQTPTSATPTPISTPTTMPSPTVTLDVPLLISPEEGALLDNGRTDWSEGYTWDFDWSDVEGATLYHLYVIAGPQFQPNINNDNIVDTSYRYESNGYIVPDTPTPTPTPTLNAPILVSPEDNVILDNGRTDFMDQMIWDFDWSDVAGATRYHLYVQQGRGGWPQINNDNISSSSYHFVSPGFMEDDYLEEWTWKVRAYVDGQWSPWSTLGYFQLEPLNTDEPRPLPEYKYNFISQAPSAAWYSYAAGSLWEEGVGESNGYACYQHSTILEDGLTYPLVLETHPNWTNWGDIGYIKGSYYDVYIPTGEVKFEAEIGFINGPTSTDGATFQIGYSEFLETQPMRWEYVYTLCGEMTVAFDGHLDYFEVDLSHLAGQTKNIYLNVDAGDTSMWDRAVWVDAQITR
jgi:hypothetical protein